MLNFIYNNMKKYIFLLSFLVVSCASVKGPNYINNRNVEQRKKTVSKEFKRNHGKMVKARKNASRGKHRTHKSRKNNRYI